MLTTTAEESMDQIDWDSWTPDESDTLLFVVHAGQVLLIRKKRGLGAGKINGPGGKIDPGETPMECAIREIGEELCIKPLNPTKCAELKFQSNDFGKILGHVFLATDFIGTPLETPEAIPVWTDVEQIPYHEMWEDDIYWLPHVLFGKHLRGEFLFHGESLLDYRVKLLSSAHHWAHGY